MNRIVGVGLPSAALVALGAASSSLLGIGVADAAPAATTSSTFQMYANVDAESHLGSNYDAVSAKPLLGDIGYVVTFSKPIGHCAAVVQPGKAGGPDVAFDATPVVNPSGTKAFNVIFSTAGNSIRDPFMMIVTCRN